MLKTQIPEPYSRPTGSLKNTRIQCLRGKQGNFPGDPVVKNLPCKAGEELRSHMPHGNYTGAPKLLSRCTVTRESRHHNERSPVTSGRSLVSQLRSTQPNKYLKKKKKEENRSRFFQILALSFPPSPSWLSRFLTQLVLSIDPLQRELLPPFLDRGSFQVHSAS